MRYVGYGILSFIIFLIGILIIGASIAPGDNAAGFILVGISMLCGILVSCTLAVVDAINRNGQEKRGENDS